MTILIKKEDLIKLLKNFNEITNLRIGIFDTNFKELYAYPRKALPICRAIKSTVEGLRKCNECDKKANTMAKEKNDIYIHRCHAGFTEVSFPISDNKEIFGYIMIGQFLSNKPLNKLWDYTVKSTKLYLDDVQKFKKNYYKLQQLNKSKIISSANIMKVCVGYILFYDIMMIQKNNLLKSIEEYIDENITEKIDANSLSVKFNLPRNNIFYVIKNETGSTLGEYIRYKRLSYAKNLLKYSEYKITDISYMCGIKDYNYFSRVFKKFYGLSPKKWKDVYIKYGEKDNNQ